ncbi:MAG: oxidoreductase [Rhodothermaceae bacterium]|nr:MAG: oxidoreductase [Rhodothermaceae bacterium]
MHHVQANGASIPALGFGTFQMKGETAYAAVRHALDLGYRHLDTAQIYANEAEVGRALAESGVAREAVFLTTKVWIDRFTSDRLAPSVDESLRRLRTDYVDLLLLHWPNPDVPLAETIRALNQVQRAGKTRHIGVSNFPTKLLREALALTDVPLVTNQVEYHPYLSQRAVLAVLREAGMCLTAYSPLAQGRLLDDPVLRTLGARYGKTPAQVALRWLLQQDGVVAIPKAARPEHAAANIDVFDFTLTDEEMRQIHGLARPDGRVVDPPGLAPAWDPA